MIDQARILITEDNPVNRKILHDVIAKEFHKPDTANNGTECLELLRQQHYDLLLLDLNMPEMNGSDVLRELQKLPRSMQPQVIVVSAESNPKVISDALELGAADYITVPFHHFELIARVTTQLRLRDRNLDLEHAVAKRTAELEAANFQLKSTQSQLILAEKMASLGQLAAGIAHEVNNPIGYLSSNIQTLADYADDLLGFVQEVKLLAEQSSDTSMGHRFNDIAKLYQFDLAINEVPQILNDCKTGASRVKQIISDLKSFSHPENRAWEQADIQSCIETVLNIVRNEIKYKADIVIDIEDNLPSFECITNQIYQVLTNIIVNASQAIDNHGTIKIRASLDSQRQQLIIDVEDNGCGMTEEVRSKVFDPFFTTKPVGEGTGLGMSVTYGIIESHRGSIAVDSEPGQGTRFRLHLPISQPRIKSEETISSHAK